MYLLKNSFVILLLTLFLAGCDDNSTDPNDDNDAVNSVVIDPPEVTLDAIGQNVQFTAKALDGNGGEVDADFIWMSSNENIVMIASNGMAEATGPGNAHISVTSNGKSDTAYVAVELDVQPSVWWTSAVSGDWNDPTKWSTGSLPQAGDTVAITLDGDYTVTLSSDVEVMHLTLGGDIGLQMLATGSNRLAVENGELNGGAELQVDGQMTISRHFEWKDGAITGSGKVEVERSAELNAGGGGDDARLDLKVSLLNNGVFALISDVVVNISDGVLENAAKLEFRSDGAGLSIYSSGSVSNSGDLVKSAGYGDSWVTANGDGSFISDGYINITTGNLDIRGGELSNVINIDSGAKLTQMGETTFRLPFYNRGEGTVEIGGSIVLGETTGEEFKFNHIILDSWQTENGITGPGNLTIVNSFLWLAGGVSGEGMVLIYDHALFTLEGSGPKKITKRLCDVYGRMESDALLNLTIQDGAQLIINRNSKWTHNGSGTIHKGIGEMSSVIIKDTFRKTGRGALTVETDLSCEGIMYLDEDVLTVKGAFNLQESGKIVGGGTDTVTDNRRLIVINAPSAVLAGTIDLDADGEPATMSILGAVTLSSSFKVLADIDPFKTIDAERLTFESGGINLAGTLEVNVKSIPPVGARYRVISTVDAAGTFDTISGVEVFTDVKEDAQGVLLSYY